MGIKLKIVTAINYISYILFVILIKFLGLYDEFKKYYEERKKRLHKNLNF